MTTTDARRMPGHRGAGGSPQPGDDGRVGRIVLWVVVGMAVLFAGTQAQELLGGELTRWVLAFGLGEFAACALALLAAGFVGRRFGSRAGTVVGAIVWLGLLVFAVVDTSNRLTQATATAPILLVATVISALMYFRWPKAVSRDIARLAAERGWATADRIPADRPAPSRPLPIPISGLYAVRNVVATPTQLAFEIRWLEWRWVFYRRRRLGVCLAAPTGARLPDLGVEPQDWVSHFVTRIVGSDVQLESEDFNRRYLVRAIERRFVYDALSTRAMQALLDRAPVALRIAGDAVFCWDDAGLSADFVDRGFGVLHAVTTTMPGHTLGEWGQPIAASPTGLRLAGRHGDEDRPMPVPRVLAIGFGLAAVMFPAMIGAARIDALTYTATADATVIDTALRPPFGPSVTVEWEADGRRVSTILDTDAVRLTEAGDRIPIRYDPDDYGSAYWVGQMPPPGGDPRLTWGLAGGLGGLAVGSFGLDALRRRRRVSPLRTSNAGR